MKNYKNRLNLQIEQINNSGKKIQNNQSQKHIILAV